MEIKLTNANFLLRKQLLIIVMRTFIFLFCVTAFALTPDNIISQNSKIKIVEDKILTVDEVFDIIMNQTKYKFFYEEGIFKDFPKVRVKKGIINTNELLKRSLSNGNLDVIVTANNAILIKEKQKKKAIPKEVLQQQISGKVTDESGQALPGTTVLVKGTTNGTQTDFDGNYTINATEGATLVFSYIGYTTQEIPITSNTTINVTLLEDASQLDEVVIVGYGTTTKKDITGSVSSVNGDDLETTPATTVIQSLQGRAAGVDIKAASNAPGGGVRIRVRGTSSINASSEPLYVVDGFPIDNVNVNPEGVGSTSRTNTRGSDPLSSISPNEIESVTILKDASAAAIYGARGANGVVLITTKRGKLGKVKISFDTFVNIATVRNKLDLANAEELAILNNEWAINNNRPLIYDGVNKPLPSELGEGTDWQDAIFRTAVTNNYNLTISGGNEGTRYLVSGNYIDQDGIIIESNFKRGGLKFNIDQNIGEKIKLGVNFNGTRSVNDAVPTDGSGFQDDTPLWNAQATTPVIPIRDAEGNYVHNHDETIKVLENPVSIAETRTDLTTTTRVLTNAFIDFEILEGLRFKANYGADIINAKRNVYIPTTAQTQARPNNGTASIGTVQNTNFLSEYTLNYKREFGNHKVDVLAGYTIQTNERERVFSSANDFFTDVLEFNNLSAGADQRPSQSETLETGLLSYIGRLNYVFNDKYSLTGTVRRDGSSVFGAENKWGVFPSVGLSWQLGEEEFIKDLNIFSNFKIRGTYGSIGNQAIAAYRSLALYDTGRPILGGGPVIGVFPERIANPDLKWETTTQSNIGVDIGLFDGKVNLTAEYYRKETDDLLFEVPIPTQSGFRNSVQNIGSVENKGFEFALGLNQDFGELRWSSNFTISFNRNKVLSLAPGIEKITPGIGQGESAHGRSLVQVGQPLGTFYGYIHDGIWDSEDEITSTGTTLGGVNRVGLVQYRDLNGDGFRQNDDDRTIVGDPNPDYIFGFSNDFSYKNFSLSIFINGSQGNDIADLNGIGLLAQPQKHNVYQEVFDNRWTGPGTSTTIEAPLTNAGEWKNFSDRNVQDGSYIRFRTISLSYNVPVDKFKGAKWFNSAQLTLSGDNLITITDYTGYDPEVDLYRGDNRRFGVDNGGYPVAKSIRIGVKLGF